MRIITNMEKIKRRTGMNIISETITGNLFRDCKLKTFMLLDDAGNAFIIADSLDRGDFEYRAKNIKDMYFNKTYLTYEGGNGKRKTDEFDDILAAFREVVRSKEVVVEEDMSIDSYYDLCELYDVKIDLSDFEEKKYNIYVRTTDSVIEQIHENDEIICQKALELFENKETAEKLKKYVYNRADTRFEKLNQMMEEYNLETTFLCSPLNVQEYLATNYGELVEHGGYALYNRNEKQIYFIADKEQKFLKDMVLLKEDISLKEALNNYRKAGLLGIEEGQISIGIYKYLNLQKENCVYTSVPLREIRENRSGEDVAYYIIAARITAFGIDTAKKWAEDMYYNDMRFTENDVFQQYKLGIKKYIEKHNIPVFTRTYDPCTYSSDRTEYCSVNTEYMIPKSAGSMRIDNGEFVLDKYGYIQATSDIARTVCFNPAVRKMHSILLKIMREDIIPGIKPGMTWGEIWKMGTEFLFEQQEIFKELDMLPENIDLKELYKRNIGHGMAKQTRTRNFIVENNNNILPPCSVGNIELPFNFRRNMVAVEDQWFCTEDETINITVG